MGCQKVSPGCDNCYAEVLTRRYGQAQWGPHGKRKRTSVAYWNKPLQWARDALVSRPRVFCASLADWLDNRVPKAWRTDLGDLIDRTPELDWLLLTKRPENFVKLSPWVTSPRNVWLGVSCEDQKHFDKRWAVMATTPATVRFVSYEPALGPLSLDSVDPLPDWMIAGGESGQGRRPVDLAWLRSARDQCREAGVPFFLKQIDKRRVIPEDLMVREFPVDKSSSLFLGANMEAVA